MKKTMSLLLVAMMIVALTVTGVATTGSTLQLGADAESGQTLAGGLLKPGEEYRFPVSVALDGGEVTPLTDEHLKDYNFRIGNTGTGHTLAEMKLIKAAGVHYVSATVKAGWPAAQTEEEYSFKLTRKGESQPVAEAVVNFNTGYQLVDDAVIDAIEQGDLIEVDNKAPTYAKEQLGRIAKRNSYKNVTFTGDNWEYVVNITDMPAINMVNNQNGIKEILNRYEGNSFEFLTFPAGPTFTANGTLHIDVQDISEEYEGNFFVYRYLNNELTLIPSRYDEQEQKLTLSTNTLGRFVITDRAITDAVVTPPSTDNSTSSNAPSTAPTPTPTPSQPQNPGTGARL